MSAQRHATIGRRSFLKQISAAGVAAVVLPKQTFPNPDLVNSRVVIVSDAQATSGSTINSSVVHVMMTRGICSLAQQADVGEAWKSLLTGVTLASRIAIKVNCLNSYCPSHRQVAYAITDTLKQMNFSGVFFPENNIIIYDRTWAELTSSGYTINTGGTGVRCFATDTPGVGYSTQTYTVNGTSQRISKIVTDNCDFLINLAVLKNHSEGGVTLCLKNHYGTCDNPGSLHGNYCDPSIPALNALQPIRAKQKVSIIDALYGIRSGGPGGVPQFVANKLIMSTDIVATDYWGRRVLQDNGCATTSYAHHIDTAAASPYSLGTNNPNEMDVITIVNPTSAGEQELPVSTRLHQNYPNPFNSQTQIQFEIPRPTDVRLDVFDEIGRKVATVVNSRFASGLHTVILDAKGIPSGAYVYQLTTADAVLSKKLLLIK
jgi:uncharacterized protein (DUF362 family)